MSVILLNGYVSDPAHVPLFDDFSTPVIHPGESGEFSFNLTNRYAAAMFNVRLTGEIYAYMTEDKYIEINKINNPPIILESGKTYFTYEYHSIPSKVTIKVSFHIKAKESTPVGVYAVRFKLEFTYNHTSYIMKSRGYFSDELWERATQNHTINLTMLGVDGIVPDSSFSVISYPPYAVFFALLALTVIFGFLAFREFIREETKPLDEEFAALKGRYLELKERMRKKKDKGG